MPRMLTILTDIGTHSRA